MVTPLTPQEDEPRLTKSDLEQFTGTSQYFRHWSGLLYTDGIAFLQERGQCYWLVDCIGSYQLYRRIRQMPWQFWKLDVHPDKSAELGMFDDIPGRQYVKQDIRWTDFCLDTITLYLNSGVLYLPSEH